MKEGVSQRTNVTLKCMYNSIGTANGHMSNIGLRMIFFLKKMIRNYRKRVKNSDFKTTQKSSPPLGYLDYLFRESTVFKKIKYAIMNMTEIVYT